MPFVAESSRLDGGPNKREPANGLTILHNCADVEGFTGCKKNHG